MLPRPPYPLGGASKTQGNSSLSGGSIPGVDAPGPPAQLAIQKDNMAWCATSLPLLRLDKIDDRFLFKRSSVLFARVKDPVRLSNRGKLGAPSNVASSPATISPYRATCKACSRTRGCRSAPMTPPRGRAHARTPDIPACEVLPRRAGTWCRPSMNTPGSILKRRLIAHIGPARPGAVELAGTGATPCSTGQIAHTAGVSTSRLGAQLVAMAVYSMQTHFSYSSLGELLMKLYHPLISQEPVMHHISGEFSLS